MNAEERRIRESAERKAHWNRWGPYLSERQWGTVREDYSAGGTAWDDFPHDHARSRAYRWGEDGLMGISDRHGEVCLALALWNGRDPILKERIFGLTNGEGNHGEDVKEYWFFTDNVPSHAYMSALYKYPQAAFPYGELVGENGRRSKSDPEYELLDTGVFEADRYFDVTAEYAKASPDDVLVRIRATNRGPETASLEILPTLWLRNTWSWTGQEPPGGARAGGPGRVLVQTPRYGDLRLYADGSPEWLFTENETNSERLYGSPARTPWVKDAFHRYVVEGELGAVNPAGTGTKVCARYRLQIAAGETAEVRLRLTPEELPAPFQGFDELFRRRIAEADEFHAGVSPGLDEEGHRIQRQALASLLWSKQYFLFDVYRWLEGDPGEPEPPRERLGGRNAEWRHLRAADVIAMPDTWEYPWFAAWDWAFHAVSLALVDPAFAKEQLLLLVRESYMHPSGQLPAYEWAFGDVNPPVQAWAAWRVYSLEKARTGVGDRGFLERIFHKLLLNFGWWVNRKDLAGDNLFQGGFLGLDNIGVFDRSQPLPTGGFLEQADGSAWMAVYAMDMMTIALELAREDAAYADISTKFFEHFLYITDAMSRRSDERGLWDEEDGFFYDALALPDGREMPLAIRSMVGLTPLFAVDSLDADLVDAVPGFEEQIEWFMRERPELTADIPHMGESEKHGRRLLAVVHPDRLRRVLTRLLDEDEFLSPHGIRALSRHHREHPYHLDVGGQTWQVAYEPAESHTGLFGGNSNWRGPVWFPVNFLLVESLREFHHFFGADFKVQCPTGSGHEMTLAEVADEISRRLISLFRKDESGRRPVHGSHETFQRDPHWRDLLLFYEYFHGDDGSGVGASHQTGWTALVAVLLHQQAARATLEAPAKEAAPSS